MCHVCVCACVKCWSCAIYLSAMCAKTKHLHKMHCELFIHLDLNIETTAVDINENSVSLIVHTLILEMVWNTRIGIQKSQNKD